MTYQPRPRPNTVRALMVVQVERDEWRARAEDAERRLAAVEALHKEVSIGGVPVCAACGEDCPCPTRVLLAAHPGTDTRDDGETVTSPQRPPAFAPTPPPGQDQGGAE